MGASISASAGGCCSDTASTAPSTADIATARSGDATSAATHSSDAPVALQRRLLVGLGYPTRHSTAHTMAMGAARHPQALPSSAAHRVEGDAAEYSLRSWDDEFTGGAPNPLLCAHGSSSAVTSGVTLIPTATASATAGSSSFNASNSRGTRMNVDSHKTSTEAAMQGLIESHEKLNCERSKRDDGSEEKPSPASSCTAMRAVSDPQLPTDAVSDAVDPCGTASAPHFATKRRCSGGLMEVPTTTRTATLVKVAGYGAPLRCVVPTMHSSVHSSRSPRGDAEDPGLLEGDGEDDSSSLLAFDTAHQINDLGECRNPLSEPERGTRCVVTASGPLGRSPRPPKVRGTSYGSSTGMPTMVGRDPSSPLYDSAEEEGSAATTATEHQDSSHRFGGAVDSLGLYRSVGGSSLSLGDGSTALMGGGVLFDAGAGFGSPTTLDGSFEDL